MNPLWNELPDHCAAIRACLEMLDENLFQSETARRGVQKWLDHLINDFTFSDLYVIRMNHENFN